MVIMIGYECSRYATGEKGSDDDPAYYLVYGQMATGFEYLWKGTAEQVLEWCHDHCRKISMTVWETL